MQLIGRLVWRPRLWPESGEYSVGTSDLDTSSCIGLRSGYKGVANRFREHAYQPSTPTGAEHPGAAAHRRQRTVLLHSQGG